MTDQLNTDLNATIAAAINAKVEASVVAALSGDETLGRYVSAALNEKIEVGGNYRKRETTFLHETIRKAIQAATNAAILQAIEEDQEQIEDLVRRAIKHQSADLAKQIATALADQAARGYGVRIEVKVPGMDS